ncbi:MAG: hypothetical protein N2651_05580, partial [Fimbriimonadales bacterium]|nr:hypothetical protein [Fimbriimonadales bacterium]
WTWHLLCSNNEWYATCSGGLCGTNPDRYAYYNNWGQSYCGSPSGLGFPGAGSTVIFPASANALLASSVDVKTVTLNSGGQLSFLSGSLLLRDPANNAPGVFNNAGLFRLPATGVGRSLRGVFVNTGTLRHEASGFNCYVTTFQNSGTVELQSGEWYGWDAPNSFTNTGVVRKRAVDVNTPGEFSIGGSFKIDNRGTVSTEQGVLRITADLDGVNAVWDVAAGAVLSWEAYGRTLGGSHRGVIAGTFVMGNSRTLTAPTTLNFSGNGVVFTEGWIYATAAPLTNAGLLRVINTGYARNLRGTFVNTGTLRHEAGSFNWDAASFQNSGTVELQDGTWQVSANPTSLQNTSVGKLLKLSSGGFTIYHLVQNAGLVEHLEGDLTIQQLSQTDGETRIHRNRTLNLSTPMELQGGKLTGAGSLNAALNHTGGKIAPGIDDPNQPSLNPLGILTLSGNLTMGANASLEVELAGTSNSDPANPGYDQLIVAGNNRAVQLNGTLRLKGRNGYTPNVGDVYDIIVRTGSWNPTGTFSAVVVDSSTLPCVQVQVRYLTDRVRVEVTRAGERPDTNGDGCVDDADLLSVLFNFGLTGENPADVNCDLLVDDADLLAVLFAFGQGC